MLQIGWIDYSKDHRDRVMRVLEMLTNPGALDELGISVVRDAFSDRLFPGTSTLLTRAKYFLIIPWIMQELEFQELPPAQFLKLLHEQEHLMSEVLHRNGETTGVIGLRAGKALRRKPSEVYWNGLRTFGIFRDSRMSIANYLQAAGKVRTFNKARRAALLRDDLVEAKDDHDADAAERFQSFWDIIPSPDDWETQMTFEFTAEEAQFLRDKIITSPHSRRSLFAYLLGDGMGFMHSQLTFSNLDAFNLPPDICRDYTMAQQFALLIFGAHLRFNILFFQSNGQPEQAEARQQEWLAWKDEIADFDFAQWDTRAMLKVMGISPGQHAYHFVLTWIDRYVCHLMTASEAEMDEFIRKREIQLKGPKRAKIGNTPHYEGEWIGVDRLEYRWRYARQIILDIAHGLEGNDASSRA